MDKQPTYEELLHRVKELELAQCHSDQDVSKLTDFNKQSRTWLECSPVCTKIVDLNYNLQYMSSSGIDALGVEDVTQLYGQPFPFDYYSESSKKKMIANMNKVIETGEVATFDADVVTTDGNTLWFLQNIVPVKGSDGELDYILVVSIDTTERKQAEQQLTNLHNELELRVKNRTAELTMANEQLRRSTLIAEQAAQSKAEFLASMSHEIRTPMNGVLGVAAMLETTELNCEQKKYLKVIKNSGNILLTVINDILDYSKVEAGKLELELTPFNFPRFVDELLEVYRLQPERLVELTLDIDPRIPEQIIGDRVRLHQVLNNLLNNAFKFTERGFVNLIVELENIESKWAVIKFTVSDTGIGIDPEKLKLLFQAFTQADQSTSRKYGGTGLGLSISQKLIALMGGGLAVQSELGAGSSFYFSVCFGIEEQPLVGSTSPDCQTDFTSLKVLVAEDNVVNQMVVMSLMDKLGVQAVMVSNGAEAVSLICENNDTFDLILMDCEMPVMDGYQATKAIREWEADHGVRQIPIYALTAHVLKEHVDFSKNSGMTGHLTKPINTEKLCKALEKIIK